VLLVLRREFFGQPLPNRSGFDMLTSFFSIAYSDIIPQLFDDDRESSWGPDKENALQRVYRVVSPFFAFLALASLTLQAIRTTSTPPNTVRITSGFTLFSSNKMKY
jgi:hypothetical protein